MEEEVVATPVAAVKKPPAAKRPPRPSAKSKAAAAAAAAAGAAMASADHSPDSGGIGIGIGIVVSGDATPEKHALNAQRDPARDAFTDFLRSRCGEGLLSELQARDAEVGVFNWALAKADERRIARNWQNPRFRSLYDAKARSVAANLCPGSYVGNERALARLADGEYLPHDIAGMHADHVFPERWREVVEAKVRRDEYMSTAKPAAMTDQFRCGRCKKRECSYMELQTRSCDEPASLFICCISCGHRWRMG